MLVPARTFLTSVLALVATLSVSACLRPNVAERLATAPVSLLPGSPLLAAGTLLTDTTEYHMIRGSRAGEQGGIDLGVGRMETQRAMRDGRSVLLLVRNFTGANFAVADTAVVAATGFAPSWESLRLGPQHVSFEYGDRSVRRAVLAPDSLAAVREHRYDGPVFHFNEVDLLARAVPLQAGFIAVLPLYSEMDDSLEHDTLSVLGRDRAGVWDVRFADAVIVGSYGIDEATRRITRYEYVSRKQNVHSHLVIAPRGTNAAASR